MTPRALLAPARLAGQPVLRTQTDERLVDLAASGSDRAFEAIVARYRRPLMGYLRRLLSQERAEEALQQTFVKAHVAIQRGEQVRTLRAWLYRIAHNAAANLIRDSAFPHEPLDEHLAGADRPDQVADRRQTFSEVISAVQSLPLRQRDAIVLRELEGRSYEEIAGELGVTNGAVRALLNRARTAIRSSVTAVTPADLLLRLIVPAADSPVPALSKMCATMLVTGTAAGGVASLPHAERDRAVHSRATSGAMTVAAKRTPASQPARPVRAAVATAPRRQARRALTPKVAARETAQRRERRERPERKDHTHPEPDRQAGPAEHHGGDAPRSRREPARWSSAPREGPGPTDRQPTFDGQAPQPAPGSSLALSSR